jgi:cell fate (sporulation/competence/biofilm development) regulator YmcA (YheA/YmcA/DUF963 family)
MILEARKQLDRLKAVTDESDEYTDDDFASRLADAEARVAEVEALALTSEEGLSAVQKGRVALAAGDRIEAMAQCAQTKSLLERGLKSDALVEAFQDLESKIEGSFRAEEGRRAGGECMAAAHAALLEADTEAAQMHLDNAREHFAQAGAVEMRGVLDALAAHILAAEERQEQELTQWQDLLEEASGLILQGDLDQARAAVDRARILCAAASATGLEEGLETIERRLEEAERREVGRRAGDEALQEAVDSVGLGNLSAARGAVARARAAYNRAGAEGMRAAVEQIEAEIAAAEADGSALAGGEGPAGSPWRKARDPRSGLEYYYHSESSWTRPDGYDSDGDQWPRPGTLRPRPPPAVSAGVRAYRRGARGGERSARARSEAGSEASGDSKPPTPDPALMPVGAGVRAGGGTVEAYAEHLGIDPAAEGGLLWIAEEGLRAPLPQGFAELADADGTRCARGEVWDLRGVHAS